MREKFIRMQRRNFKIMWLIMAGKDTISMSLMVIVFQQIICWVSLRYQRLKRMGIIGDFLIKPDYWKQFFMVNRLH